MGLKSWFRSRRSKSPRPPWVRPEFLGLFALLVVASTGAGYWAWAAAEGGSQEAYGAAKTTYVGVEPADLQACLPGCDAETALAEWIRQNPDQQVVRVTPRVVEGVVIGYYVEHR